jgi:hypothetical protein
MRVPSVVLAVVGVVWSTAALADPHPMSSGANPAPTTDAEVAMVAETLAIDIGPRTASVNAAVTLENRGAATSLVVGFPCATGPDAGAVDPPCKLPVKVTANGKKVRVSRKKASKTLSHWLWTLKLAAGEKLELVVSYRAPLVNERYSVPADGMGLFAYRLTTGARWAGPIGTLQITVDHLHDALLFVSPPGYTREAGRITWKLTDHEPTEEVVLIPYPRIGNWLADAAGAKTSAELRTKVAAGDVDKAKLEALVKEMADGAELIDTWLPTITRISGVPMPARERVTAAIAESIALVEAAAATAKR